MNVNDKRLALELFCETRECSQCHQCNGHFKRHNYLKGDSLDSVVVNCLYDAVFNDAEKDDGEKQNDTLKWELYPDMVNSPKHYSLPGDMEVIDVEVATQGVEAVKEHCVCAAIEYLLRHKRKNGAEDVKKAHWWLSKYVELSEKETE